MKKVFAAMVLLLCLTACGGPEEEEELGPTANMDGRGGYVWMMPKGDTFLEFMDDDNLEQWKETLAVIDIIGYADHVLNREYTRTQHEAGFAVMKEIGLPLALEVGAVKEWGRTGQATYTSQRRMWNNFTTRGATIAGIVMDEPLAAVYNHYATHFTELIPENTPAAKFEYAVEETAEFMRLVLEEYEDWFIACIEPFPWFSADYLIEWIDALEARLADKDVRGQEFFRLDVDWNAFGKYYTNAHGESRYLTWEQGWREVKRIEDHCRSIGLPFSLIYWAADVAGSAALQANPASWYNSILQMGQRYRSVGGRPDQYVVQTWIGLPDKTLPEDHPHSFAYSVVEFNKQIIPPYPHGGDHE